VPITAIHMRLTGTKSIGCRCLQSRSSSHYYDVSLSGWLDAVRQLRHCVKTITFNVALLLYPGLGLALLKYKQWRSFLTHFFKFKCKRD